MNILDTLVHFAQRESREPFEGMEFRWKGVDLWAEAMTALCSLSGGLEEAESGDELDELVEHCDTLMNIGVVTYEQLKEEIGKVVEAVAAQVECVRSIA